MKILKKFFNKKVKNDTDVKNEPVVIQTYDKDQQIKDCLFRIWQYCQKNGYILKGWKEGKLVPDIIDFELVITEIDKV